MITQKQSLWQISHDLKSLFSSLYDSETGEINEEVQARIDALEDSAEKKCTAIASWIKKMEAEKKEIDFYKEEIEKREMAYKKEITRWQEYLKSNMERCNISEIKAPFFTIKLKKNPYSTDIYDETLIPDRFMKEREIVKTEIKPDKNAIKEEVLKTGIAVPGANVKQTLKLEIITDRI